MLQVDPLTYLLAAIMLLVFPLNWLFAAIIAAVFHELCHLSMLFLLKGNLRSIRVYSSGCVMEVDRMREIHQFISILAGPMGSLSLIFLCRIAPRIAVCGLIQGVYNLIPIMPLDGGRMLRIILYGICPERTERIMKIVEVILRLTMMLGILFLTVSRLLHPISGISLILLNIKLTLRKIPCKQSKIGVQ